MSLLTVIQEAASALGLRQPSTVVGSTDLTAQILLRLANEAGRHLARYHDWQALIVETTVTATSTILQSGALPTASYDRLAYNAEFWNTTRGQRLVGPTPQRYWRRLRNGTTTTGVSGYWRIIGKQLYIAPAPTSGDLIAFEYISKQYCESSGGTDQSEFMADTDEFKLDEELLVLEIVWRFRKSRGFAQYAEDMETAEREKEKAASRDRGTGRMRVERSTDTGPPAPTWSGEIDG